MQRQIYAKLAQWKASQDRKPLILKGARQVGKTHSLKAFGQTAYRQVVYLNFETRPSLHSLFQDNINPMEILRLISLDQNLQITAQDTLVIFDEVQACPLALNSLKYFCEAAPDYHICAAGSLLGVKLANTQGFPVGKVDFLSLGPLSFFEFLRAIHENHLCDHLETLESPTPLAEILHTKLHQLFKIYLYVGGMPEAVAHYSEHQDLLKIREIQNNILSAYELDFAKHAPQNEVMRIYQVWRSLPAQLAKENRKFMYSLIRTSARAKEFETALQWLTEANLLNKVTLLSKPSLPLAAYAKFEFFKIYHLDVGLLGASVNLPASLLAHGNKILEEFSGVLAENYAAQTLLTLQPALFYWASENTAEIDFIIQHHEQLYPLEIKSGTSSHKKSLLLYDKKFQPSLLLRSSPMNLKQDGQLLNCPLYLLERLFHFNSLNIDAS